MDIGVVLVTYNRLDKLKIALESYNKQTLKPKYVLVVNNNSTDGTDKYLDNWKNSESEYERFVLNLDKNTGGSGGFYQGLKKSLELNAKWIWVADDDAYPKGNAFSVANEYLLKNKNEEKLSAVSGKVIKQNGEIDFSHRRNIEPKFGTYISQKYSKPADYAKESFEINAFSYVGTMINKDKLTQTDLTKKDYFIYFDDTEHSYRLSKLGKIVCIPAMEVVHDAPHADMSEIVKWKLYYLVRNTLDFIKSNFDKKYFDFACFYVRFEFNVAVLLFGKNKKYGYMMTKEAVKDAKAGKTGLHEIYKPGWNPEK